MPTTRHPLEAHITCTGLRRAALFLDTAGAIHRCNWNKSQGELAALAPAQVLMVLILLNAKPGHPAWTWAETRLGKLPYDG